eukprot:15012326-Alexandrium_andersonii.AAC.1
MARPFRIVVAVVDGLVDRRGESEDLSKGLPAGRCPNHTPRRPRVLGFGQEARGRPGRALCVRVSARLPPPARR